MIGVFDVSQGSNIHGKYLEQSLQEDLKKIFANLVHPVKIIYFSTKEKCAYCTEISELLGEVTDLSEKLLLETHDINEENHLAKRYDVVRSPVSSSPGWMESVNWITGSVFTVCRAGMNSRRSLMTC